MQQASKFANSGRNFGTPDRSVPRASGGGVFNSPAANQYWARRYKKRFESRNFPDCDLSLMFFPRLNSAGGGIVRNPAPRGAGKGAMMG